MNVQGISPKIMAPVMAQSANRMNATANASSTSTGATNSSGTSASNLQGTFLNLLVTELQNQDPTSPVDPTQMVSQMVSLNQLNQLISINQTLQGMTSQSAGSSSSSGTAQAKSQITVNPNKLPTAKVPSSPAASQQLQTDYTGVSSNSGLMNLYGSYSLPTPTSISKQIGVR